MSLDKRGRARESVEAFLQHLPLRTQMLTPGGTDGPSGRSCIARRSSVHPFYGDLVGLVATSSSPGIHRVRFARQDLITAPDFTQMATSRQNNHGSLPSHQCATLSRLTWLFQTSSARAAIDRGGLRPR
jgi:hypothetical protein